MLYGFGSKRKLVEEFLAHVCEADGDASVLVINGTQPACSVKHVADTITKRVLGSSLRFGSLGDQCRFIALQMGGRSLGGDAVATPGSGTIAATSGPRLYIAVHNIDGQSLRSAEAQNALRHRSCRSS
jgi:hypothetical protein